MARATKDIDVDWARSRDEAIELLLGAARHDLRDFFSFRIEGADSSPDRAILGRSWRLIADLDDREFETVLVDVDFDTAPLFGASELLLPTALDFAGVRPITVPVLGLEQHVAEKVHAYTRRYGAGADPSSRVKDLVDIVLVAERLELEAGRLSSVLAKVFGLRDTHQLPRNLPKPPADWRRAWRRFAEDLGVPAELHEGHRQAAAMIDPVLVGRRTGRWSPESVTWTAD